jgi:hypothetical protein
MLEDMVTGPLYKTILSRSKKDQKLFDYIVGPWNISVSKINQWVSLFVIMVWVLFIVRYLVWLNEYGIIGLRYWLIIVITIVFMFMMVWRGKTHGVDYKHIASRRDTKITVE